MTENEAIEILKNNFPKKCKMVEGRYKGGFDDTECEFGQALLLSISALEEIQKYRSIGTIEEIKDILIIMSEHTDDANEETGISTEMLHICLENAAYANIGTIDECRKAMEMQKKKKPNLVTPCKSVNYYQCPVCGELVPMNGNFCNRCGQALYWED